VYPKGGGKGRKRLYEERLTAGGSRKGQGELCRQQGSTLPLALRKEKWGNVPSFGRMAV